MESRRDAYRRIEETAARRIADWPEWMKNPPRVPAEKIERIDSSRNGPKPPDTKK